MQVNVFVVRDGEGQQKKLLVLPIRPSAKVPVPMQDEWVYFATVDSGDKLLAASAAQVELDITRQGYAVVEPTG